MKKNIIKFFIPVFLLCLALTGCIKPPEPEVLGDLVYTKKNEKTPTAFTVYLPEKDSMEPYLVLKRDYDGGTLLMRQYLWDEKVAYSTHPNANSEGSRSSYYPVSNVDAYLNTVFFEAISPKLKELILESTIKVSSLNAFEGNFNRETENIIRKVFLLSAREMDINTGLLGSEDGEPLDYFIGRKVKNGVAATYKNGEVGNHQLRSAYHWSDRQIWVITSSTKSGGGSAGPIGIRPAFCLSAETPIVETEIDGKKAYTLAEEN